MQKAINDTEKWWKIESSSMSTASVWINLLWHWKLFASGVVRTPLGDF